MSDMISQRPSRPFTRVSVNFPTSLSPFLRPNPPMMTWSVSPVRSLRMLSAQRHASTSKSLSGTGGGKTARCAVFPTGRRRTRVASRTGSAAVLALGGIVAGLATGCSMNCAERSSSTQGPALALVRVQGRTAPVGSGAKPQRSGYAHIGAQNVPLNVNPLTMYGTVPGISCPVR